MSEAVVKPVGFSTLTWQGCPRHGAFFWSRITQHVRSFPILYDLLTLAATLLNILLWGLCLSLWAP